MNKRDRQAALLKVVNSGHIANQSTLVSALNSSGFRVTQASISRDLEEMGIAKKDGVYRVKPPPTEDALDRVVFETAGDSLVIGHCASGMASAMTVRIDSAGIGGIAGTIAGDDTIFIAVKVQDMQQKVLGALRDFFGQVI